MMGQAVVEVVRHKWADGRVGRTTRSVYPEAVGTGAWARHVEAAAPSRLVFVWATVKENPS